MERRALLETLASKLPPGAISFSSKLKSISEQGRAGTLLELEDGRQILAKVRVGELTVLVHFLVSQSLINRCSCRSWSAATE